MPKKKTKYDYKFVVEWSLHGGQENYTTHPWFSARTQLMGALHAQNPALPGDIVDALATEYLQGIIDGVESVVVSLNGLSFEVSLA